jgi:hypothetical protein
VKRFKTKNGIPLARNDGVTMTSQEVGEGLESQFDFIDEKIGVEPTLLAKSKAAKNRRTARRSRL